MSGRRSRTVPTLWLIALSVAVTARAAEPTVRTVDIRALRIGATTTLTIDGTDLLPEPQLLLPFEAQVEIQAEPAPQANRVIVAVTLKDDVTPGVYPLRVVTAGGVSAPVVIGVDRLPQLPIAAKIKLNPKTLSAALHGSRIAKLVREKPDEKALIEELYLWTLARRPTDDERALAVRFFASYGEKRAEAAQDLAWALLNSRDFLLVH